MCSQLSHTCLVLCLTCADGCWERRSIRLLSVFTVNMLKHKTPHQLFHGRFKGPELDNFTAPLRPDDNIRRSLNTLNNVVFLNGKINPWMSVSSLITWNTQQVLIITLKRSKFMFNNNCLAHICTWPRVFRVPSSCDSGEARWRQLISEMQTWRSSLLKPLHRASVCRTSSDFGGTGLGSVVEVSGWRLKGRCFLCVCVCVLTVLADGVQLQTVDSQ